MGHPGPRLFRLVCDRGPVHCVAARRVAAVGPVENTVLWSSSRSIGSGGPSKKISMSDGGNLGAGTEDAAKPGIVWAFLRPVDMSEFRVDRQPNAPSCLIPAIGFAASL